MYFRLLPHVFLVKGKNNSLIQDTLHQTSYLIDHELSLLLEKCEHNNSIPENCVEVLKLLEQKNIGKITNHPIFVDKLRFDNAFYNSFFQNMLNINSATIQLTNICHLNCNICNKITCPSCIRSHSQSSPLSLQEWISIIDILKKSNCKEIIFTGGDVSLYPNLNKLISYVSCQGLRATVNIHEKVSKLNIDKSASLNILISNQPDLNSIFTKFKDFHHVTLMYCFPVKKENIRLPQNFSIKIKPAFHHTFNQDNIPCPDIYSFYAKMHSNPCIAKKMVIQSNADVYPCIGAIKNALVPVGNMLKDNLTSIIYELFINYWIYSVNDKSICKFCEFRYSCHNCALTTKCIR